MADQNTLMRDVEIESLRHGLGGIGRGNGQCDRHEEPGEKHCPQRYPASPPGYDVQRALDAVVHSLVLAPLARSKIFSTTDYNSRVGSYVQF
jgi:hypothetical protein